MTLANPLIPRHLKAGLFAFCLLSVCAWAQPAYVGPSFFDTLGGFGFPRGARTGDIDGDGDVDGAYLKNGQIIAILNDGMGNFTQVPSPGPSAGAFFRLGDLDGDGELDLVATTGSQLTTWIHTGGGQFSPDEVLAIGGGLVRNPVVLNLNPGVDNDMDVAYIETNNGIGRIRLLSNDGTGQLSNAGLAFNLGGYNGSKLEAGDMDGDGDDDLVATYQLQGPGNSRMYIHRNNGTGFFTQASFITLTQTTYLEEYVLADVTGDNRNDVVTYNATDVVTYVNGGNGIFGSTQVTPTPGNNLSGIGAADVDGDGNIDAIATDDQAPYPVIWLRGAGNGLFLPTALPQPGANPNPCCVNLDDLTGDGVPDLLYTVRGGSVASIAKVLFGVEPVDFRKVMITEASWGNPDFVEIANFSLSPQNLNGWTLEWRDSITRVSMPLAMTLQPGEPAIIGEPGTSANLALPPAIQVVDAFPSIGTVGSDFAVALKDASGDVVDELHVSSSTGAFGEASLGGYFRGLAVRSTSSGVASVERIWGLDSNSGSDWCEAPLRSPGYENTTSGQRGTDTIPVQKILIYETDDTPDYIELYNPNAFPVDVTGWTLWCSSLQNSNHQILSPFSSGYVMAPGEFLVIGDAVAPPGEMPGGTTYIDVPQNIPWGGSEYDCSLYDAYGRCVDLMRTTGNDDAVVHNHPRAPSAWNDFTGAAGRLDGGGADAVGRRTAFDTDRGDDFEPVFSRTMGGPNLVSSFSSFDEGLDSQLDVRLDDHPLHGGFSMIINAGPANAGMKYSFFIGIGHQSGQGPFLGLGLDAVLNWIDLKDVFPFGANLDANGSHVIHLPPVTSLPAGFDADIMGILQDASGALVTRTAVIEFDTF